LFKISNLVLGGKAIVRRLYSSLERQRQRENQFDACRGSDTGNSYLYNNNNNNNNNNNLLQLDCHPVAVALCHVYKT